MTVGIRMGSTSGAPTIDIAYPSGPSGENPCGVKEVIMVGAFSRMLFMEGLSDWVMLAALRMGFIGEDPSEDRFVAKSRAALEPLLRDGLMVMGDLTAPGGRFHAWDVSVEECLDRFEWECRDDHTPHKTGDWSWGTWLCLTPKGEVVAEECYASDPDPLGIDASRYGGAVPGGVL
ncbi:MAG: hypothetical protein FWD75_08250 [Propionibacteriaceae bacterium]|nr:hypothetical protein [Propionibacteriaceae bacterium]